MPGGIRSLMLAPMVALSLAMPTTAPTDARLRPATGEVMMRAEKSSVPVACCVTGHQGCMPAGKNYQPWQDNHGTFAPSSVWSDSLWSKKTYEEACHNIREWINPPANSTAFGHYGAPGIYIPGKCDSQTDNPTYHGFCALAKEAEEEHKQAVAATSKKCQEPKYKKCIGLDVPYRYNYCDDPQLRSQCCEANDNCRAYWGSCHCGLPDPVLVYPPLPPSPEPSPAP